MVNIDILVIEDQKMQRERLYNILSDEGYHLETAACGADALQLIKKNRYHLVLLDLKLPDISGIEVLKQIRQIDPECQVIMLSAYGSIKTAIDAIKNGAYDFITKPYEADELLSLIYRASEFLITRHQNILLKAEIERYKVSPEIIYASNQMKSVIQSIKLVAPENSNVLIQGESGTGKELIARAIHDNSRRKSKSFVVVNCAAFQDALLESDLFGHEKGSFTGAAQKKPGLVEIADGGTLFLDEVGELSPQIQAKLLRFVEHGELRRVGGVKTSKVNVRIISATNKELAAPEFRQDLFYRLNVFAIQVPPLRERKDDIILLGEHFLKKCAPGRNMRLSEEVKALFSTYHWPGNIRELHNVVEQATILSQTDVIHPEVVRIKNPDDHPLHRDSEDKLIISALSRFNGHREQTARFLGISVRTLYRKIRQYDLENKAQ